MSIRSEVLAAAAIGYAGLAASSWAAPDDATTSVSEIVSAIQFAPKVETFFVACNPLLPPGIRPDSIPRIAGWCRVLEPGPDVDAGPRTTLASLVQVAARDSCQMASCLFGNGVAFRFHDRVPPLDLLISADCMNWMFYRGSRSVTSEAGLTPFPGCIRDSLRRVLSTVFADKYGSFRYNWPNAMDR